MKQKMFTECQGCGSSCAFIVFVPQYRGFRGCCPDCGTNWPES